MWQLLQNSGREVYQPAAPAMTTIRKAMAAQHGQEWIEDAPHLPPDGTARRERRERVRLEGSMVP